jgi:uncharacterized protein (DUF924 family)
MDHARDVLDYWFGREPFDLATLRERMGTWFGGERDRAGADLDADLRRRFGALVERAVAGELDAWAASPNQRLALILLLDQFPRNIHRRKPAAFAGDDRALALTLEGMMQAADAMLDPVRRIFFYMPLQHSEQPDVQDESVTAFRRLRDEAPAALRPVFEDCLRFAERHRDIVRRFGRFPHRNAILGRPHTREEREWLLADGESFGQ